MVIEWYPVPGCILSSSSVTGIECLERYAWLEWAADEWKGGCWGKGAIRLRAVAHYLAVKKEKGWA